MGKFRAIHTAVVFIGLCALTAAAGIPLGAVERMVEALAGQETALAATVDTSIKVSLGLSAGLSGAGWKVFAQRKELIRCRQRIARLEQALARAENNGKEEGR